MLEHLGLIGVSWRQGGSEALAEFALNQERASAQLKEFAEHFGRPCPRPREIPVPKIVDIDEHGAFVYDERYHLKQPDWTYAPA